MAKDTEIGSNSYADGKVGAAVLQARFRDLQKLYDDLEAFTRSGHWQLDTSTNIIHWSEGASIILGLSADYRVMTLDTLFEICKKGHEELLRNFLNDEGRQARLSAILVTLEDQDGFTTDVVIAIRDVSVHNGVKTLRGFIRNTKESLHMIPQS